VHLDRGGEPYALLMVDIDDMSAINETQGRERGDQALRLVGSVLQDIARASDLCARYGEEEFTLVMPGASLRGALSAGMRLRSQLQEAASRTGLFLTVSVGAAARPEHGQGVEALLLAAEGAVVDAKEMGKDQLAPARMLPPIQLPQM
jgi:diguanylate cyclase (GGDEF)-like protein